MVHPSRTAKTIDHFIISGTKNIIAYSADKILPGLEKIASLIPVFN
jgi:hypothetical protein